MTHEKCTNRDEDETEIREGIHHDYEQTDNVEDAPGKLSIISAHVDSLGLTPSSQEETVPCLSETIVHDLDV